MALALKQGFDSDVILTCGDSATLEIEIRDECGVAVDLTGATVIFAVAQCPGGTVLISKSTDNAGEGSILDGPRGLAEIVLTFTDTSQASIPKGCDLVYEVRVQLAGGDRHTVDLESPVFRIEQNTASFT